MPCQASCTQVGVCMCHPCAPPVQEVVADDYEECEEDYDEDPASFVELVHFCEDRLLGIGDDGLVEDVVEDLLSPGNPHPRPLMWSGGSYVVSGNWCGDNNVPIHQWASGLLVDPANAFEAYRRAHNGELKSMSRACQELRPDTQKAKSHFPCIPTQSWLQRHPATL